MTPCSGRGFHCSIPNIRSANSCLPHNVVTLQDWQNSGDKELDPTLVAELKAHQAA